MAGKASIFEKAITRLTKERPLSFRALTTAIALIIAIASLIVMFVGARMVREKAIHDLAREEARELSQLVFQSLFSAMAKGWTKEEIGEIIKRLNTVQPNMEIKVFRGFPVINQFGEMPGEEEVRKKDLLLMKALKGEESLITNKQDIRYYYPIRAKEVCKRCHTMQVGDIAGVIDISYPVQNLKVSLNFLINTGLIFFTTFLILTFAVFYFSVRSFIVKPVTQLVGVIAQIITEADLNKRVPRTSYIIEILHLTDYFNKLLHTVQDYYQKLEELSFRDPLTNLYNRRKFEEFLQYEIYRSQRHNHRFSLLMIDLDDFKYINDTYGHPTGDIVLKELASIIKRNMRRSDIVARVGGDEFAIILPEMPLEKGVMAAEKLKRIISETPLTVMSGRIMVRMSFGVAEYPQNAENVKDILIASDVALYRAKQGGKNRVAQIEEGVKGVRMEIISRGEAIKKAIEEDRIEAFFQPIVEVATKRVFGFDCLARIREEEGYILAEEFRHTAEEMGYIERIDTIVIEKGLSHLRRLKEKGESLKLFFNSSTKRFFANDFVSDIIERLNRYEISPDAIVFQIAENETLPHITEFMELIGRLKTHGIGFLLKKFGSGFSSFTYLRYLEVEYVKIDGEFIRNIGGDRQKRILVTNMHKMLTDFNIKTIAEYVEDEETHRILKEIGVGYGQGSYYGMPAIPS